MNKMSQQNINKGVNENSPHDLFKTIDNLSDKGIKIGSSQNIADKLNLLKSSFKAKQIESFDITAKSLKISESLKQLIQSQNKS